MLDNAARNINQMESQSFHSFFHKLFWKNKAFHKHNEIKRKDHYVPPSCICPKLIGVHCLNNVKLASEGSNRLLVRDSGRL